MVVSSIPVWGNILFSFRSSGNEIVYRKWDRMWRTECFSTKFPLSSLLHAGYTMKPKKYKSPTSLRFKQK